MQCGTGRRRQSLAVGMAMRCLTTIVTWPLLAHGTALRASGMGPSWKEAVECSNSVTRLSTEMRQLLHAHQVVDRNCADAKRYYQTQAKHVDKAIAYYKSRARARPSDDELTKRYTERYTGSMCMKTYDAFFNKDGDTRLEVSKICLGRIRLAPGSMLDDSLGHAAKEACPDARAMQARVNMLRSAKAKKVGQCRKDKKELKDQLDKKRAQEDALEDKHYDHHDNKQDLRKKIAKEVTDKFCAVIQKNYKFKEQVIQTFWHNSCD